MEKVKKQTNVFLTQVVLRVSGVAAARPQPAGVLRVLVTAVGAGWHQPHLLVGAGTLGRLQQFLWSG